MNINRPNSERDALAALTLISRLVDTEQPYMPPGHWLVHHSGPWRPPGGLPPRQLAPRGATVKSVFRSSNIGRKSSSPSGCSATLAALTRAPRPGTREDEIKPGGAGGGVSDYSRKRQPPLTLSPLVPYENWE